MPSRIGNPVASELASLLAWLREAPPGTSLDATLIAEKLEGMVDAPVREPVDAREPTWREKLWTVPPETRMGRDELLEAVGRSANWLYRHTSAKSECSRIPHRKLDGELVFVVGEVREWLCEHEEIVVQGRSMSFAVPAHRGKEAA